MKLFPAGAANITKWKLSALKPNQDNPTRQEHDTMLTSQDFYYIGVDVGTGSARACVIDSLGEIKGLASEDIRLWKAYYGYDETHYVSAGYRSLPLPYTTTVH